MFYTAKIEMLFRITKQGVFDSIDADAVNKKDCSQNSLFYLNTTSLFEIVIILVISCTIPPYRHTPDVWIISMRIQCKRIY